MEIERGTMKPLVGIHHGIGKRSIFHHTREKIDRGSGDGHRSRTAHGLEPNFADTFFKDRKVDHHMVTAGRMTSFALILVSTLGWSDMRRVMKMVLEVFREGQHGAIVAK